MAMKNETIDLILGELNQLRDSITYLTERIEQTREEVAEIKKTLERRN